MGALPGKCKELEDDLIVLQEVGFLPLWLVVHRIFRVHQLGRFLVAVQEWREPRVMQAGQGGPRQNTAMAEGERAVVGYWRLTPSAMQGLRGMMAGVVSTFCTLSKTEKKGLLLASPAVECNMA